MKFPEKKQQQKYKIEKKLLKLAPLALKVAKDILKSPPKELKGHSGLYLQGQMADRILKKIADLKVEQLEDLLPPKVEIIFEKKEDELKTKRKENKEKIKLIPDANKIAPSSVADKSS